MPKDTPKLGRHEFDVLCLIAKGRTKVQAAKELGVSLHVVNGRINKGIYPKLGAHTLAEAVTRAYYHGILVAPLPRRTLEPPDVREDYSALVPLPRQIELVNSWLRSGYAKWLRRQAGLSQRDLARAADCHHIALRRWENCQTQPQSHKVPAYFRCLAVLAASLPEGAEFHPSTTAGQSREEDREAA